MITTEWFFGGQGLDDAHYIRRKVFIEEQGIEEAIEMDDTDAGCIHLVAYENSTIPVATGRIRIDAGEFSIGRVAVLPEYRGKNYGIFIMQVLIHACFSMGGNRQVIHAQVTAGEFYKRLGFVAVGDVYDEAGIPHITMEHIGDSEPLCKRKADLKGEKLSAH